MSIDICQELHQNFIDFAYEANSQRAFPDARDGLKPGQRAALWLMFNKGYTSNKPHVKSAKISGAIIGENLSARLNALGVAFHRQRARQRAHIGHDILNLRTVEDGVAAECHHVAANV